MFIFNDRGHILIRSMEEGGKVLDALYAMGWCWRSGASPPRHYEILKAALYQSDGQVALCLEINTRQYGMRKISYDSVDCIGAKKIEGEDFLRQYQEYLRGEAENAKGKCSNNS